MARPLEFDRCLAIQKAREVFHRSGYEAASVDDLTQALGISRASLYNTFGDKRGLLMATLEATCVEGRLMAESAEARRCSSKRIVRELFERLASDEGEGCYLLTIGAELSASDPDVKARVKQGLEQSRAMFVELLSRNPELSAKQVEAKAAALLGAMVSVLTLRRVYPDAGLMAGVIAQAVSVLD